MDSTFTAPQYAYLTPQLEDDHLLLSGNTTTHFSQSSSCSTPEYISDAPFEWELATVDGIRVNPGHWPTSSLPYPEQYGDNMQPILLSHQDDPLWPFASRGIPQDGTQCDSLLGESFDALMKSINQRAEHPQHQPFDSNNFQYFTPAHLQLEDPSLAPLQSSKLFENINDKAGPYIHSNNAISEPSLVRRSPHIRGSHNRERSSSVKTRRAESSNTTHKCDSCSYSFSRARDLTRHYRLHTGERPYKCDACDERFIRSDARKRHWDAQPSCRLIHDQKNSNGSSSKSK